MVQNDLDHDFNNIWGSVLGVAEHDNRPVANSLKAQYWSDPIRTGRKYNRILEEYTERFESFFSGTLPISFHGHVTDAMCPTTVASLLMRLAIVSTSDCPDSIHDSGDLDRKGLATVLGWTKRQLDNPRWVAVEDSFAAGFGPLANLSAQPAFRAHAAGSPSISLRLVNRSQADLVRSLARAKEMGCIGVIVEVVNNQLYGRVTTAEQLGNLRQACIETELMLVIDETITAVRCGAPFAHQRPEYQEVGKPDLVFFGKGLGANGIGINFDGPFMKKLGIQAHNKRRQAIRDWQAVVTQPLHLPVLIEALGILEMAVAGDWARRASIIGRHLREIAMERAIELNQNTDDDGSPVLGGLDSFIFIRKDIAATFLVMGASNAGPWVHWVRWMPRMDPQFTDRLALDSLLSEEGRYLRKDISQCLDTEGLKPQWCFYCGNKAGRDRGVPWCKACCVDACGESECIEHLLSHKCLGSDAAFPYRSVRL